jgi:hypothetical protein
MKVFKKTVDSTVDDAVDRTTTRLTDKVKTHFRENKKVYLAIVGTGVVMYVLNGRSDAGTMLQRVTVVGKSGDIQQIQTIDVHIEALGDPGNIIQDLDTGIIYASQGQAARELGLSVGEVSKHLNGRNDHVKGHKFAKLGKAHVAE